MNSPIPDFLYDHAPIAAKKLIGWQFYVREPNGTLSGGTIVETEAYTADDEASHSFRGKTKRNSAMFEKAGTIYVYFTYGMHYCCNIVTGDKGIGEAVLIRSVIPTRGIDAMLHRRGKMQHKHLCDGPAKLCQALDITTKDGGETVGANRFFLRPPQPTVDTAHIKVTPRIGISRSRDKMWRFVLEI